MQYSALGNAKGNFPYRAAPAVPTYGEAILQQGETRCVWKATPSASRQLPREGAMYGKIHVVGNFSRPIDFISTRYPGNTTKGALARELARAAGARLRELPSAAAQQDEETNLVVRGSCPPPQRNCCVAAKSRGTDVRGSHPVTGRIPVRMEGNSFSLSGVCDDRGQHAADTAAAREPCIERSM